MKHSFLFFPVDTNVLKVNFETKNSNVLCHFEDDSEYALFLEYMETRIKLAKRMLGKNGY